MSDWPPEVSGDYPEQGTAAWRRSRLMAIWQAQRAGRELSPDQRTFLVQEAINWLRGKWGESSPCPYCGNLLWEIGTPLNIAQVEGKPLSPHFPAMCSNCGHTVFINAIRAGLAPEEDERSRG